MTINTTIKKILFSLLTLILLLSFSFANAESVDNLKGRFLLQVEDSGRIWYVNPDDNLRYEIKQLDAFETFRIIAKGISEKELSDNLDKFRGKILFQKQGERYWYVDLSSKKHELIRKDLISVLKKIFIGVKNKDLYLIEEKNSSQNQENIPTITIDLDQSNVLDPQLKRFVDVWTLVKQKYSGPIDYDKAMLAAIDGMLKSLGDEYTTFFSATSSDNFLEELEGNFEGIGVEINVKNNIISIVSVLENTPAQKAGLFAGDSILFIDGKNTSNMTTDEASKLIRGKSGTEVILTILRNGQYKYINVIRDSIHYDSVNWEIKHNNIGYIKIRSFNSDTSDLVDEAIFELLSKNIKGIILDLRGNPGGYLETSIKVASNWIENNVVVIEKSSNKSEPTNLFSKGIAKLKNTKTIILIDGGSASASEILAGALQDYGLATLIGEKTFGKGSVQDFSTFSDGSSIKITIANWLTPKGRIIDKIGIIPNIEIINENNSNIDLQLNKAIELLK